MYKKTANAEKGGQLPWVNYLSKLSWHKMKKRYFQMTMWSHQSIMIVLWF